MEMRQFRRKQSTCHARRKHHTRQWPYDGRTDRSPLLSANDFDGIRSGDIRAGKCLHASLDIPAHALICRVSAPLRVASFAGERVAEGRLATGRALPYALLRRVHTTFMSVLGSRARHLRAMRLCEPCPGPNSPPQQPNCGALVPVSGIDR